MSRLNSSFAIILMKKRKLIALLNYLTVFLLPCECLCSLSRSLPHGSMGWSVVVAVTGHTQLFLSTFFFYLAGGLLFTRPVL